VLRARSSSANQRLPEVFVLVAHGSRSNAAKTVTSPERFKRHTAIAAMAQDRLDPALKDLSVVAEKSTIHKSSSLIRHERRFTKTNIMVYDTFGKFSY
jgi:hypothetical protein